MGEAALPRSAPSSLAKTERCAADPGSWERSPLPSLKAFPPPSCFLPCGWHDPVCLLRYSSAVRMMMRCQLVPPPPHTQGEWVTQAAGRSSGLVAKGHSGQCSFWGQLNSRGCWHQEASSQQIVSPALPSLGTALSGTLEGSRKGTHPTCHPFRPAGAAERGNPCSELGGGSETDCGGGVTWHSQLTYLMQTLSCPLPIPFPKPSLQHPNLVGYSLSGRGQLDLCTRF